MDTGVNPIGSSNRSASRRTTARYEVTIPVMVEHHCRIETGLTRNVSLGGMFVTVADRVPPGTNVILRFFLPHLSEPILAPAQVRWVADQTGLGLQFGGLRERETWALQRLFERAPKVR
jgi:hypothetical protein